MYLKNNRWLWIFTAAYFVLAFVNIQFGLLAILCMITPFILLWRDRRKTWCQAYCPRASLLTRFSPQKTKASPVPKWLTSDRTKRYIVNYFIFNITIMMLSTTMVALGKMAPMLMPRFMILFPIPTELPQLIVLSTPAWLMHLSYRLFSMMMTTTVVGLILAWLYRSRTWCAICPIATLSDQALQQASKNQP